MLLTRTGLAATLDLVTLLRTSAHSVSTFSSHPPACPYLWLKRCLALPIIECTASDSCDPADQTRGRGETRHINELGVKGHLAVRGVHLYDHRANEHYCPIAINLIN